MTQKYNSFIKRDSIRQRSLEIFLTSGRQDTIKKNIVVFLKNTFPNSFTAAEIQRALGIKYRSSVCGPLKQLVDDGYILQNSEKYDPNTGREVGTYIFHDEQICSITIEICHENVTE